MSDLTSGFVRQPDAYGDVTGEYVAARSEVGAVMGRFGVFWVAGPDAVSFLQGIVSQDIAAMPPGSVGRSLLLEPRGKLRDVLWVLRGDDRVGLVSAVDASATMDELARWKIRVEADLHLDDRPAVALVGPHAAGAVQSMTGGTAGEGAWSDVETVTAAHIPMGPVDRYLVLGASPEAISAAAPSVGRLAYDALRIEAGEGQMGVDIDEKTIPQEAGLVADTVSFTKGCYLGQELVARIDSRGHVNRRLRGVVLSDAVIPPVGAHLVHEGDDRGVITSVAESLTLRAPVALALVRREVADDAAVTVRWDGGEASATVRALPLVSDKPGV